MMKKKSMLIALYSAVVLLVALVAMSVQHAPIFSLNIMVVVTIIICYVLTEDWTTHDAIEFENRFWTFVAGMLARACVFCSDSPLRLADEHNGLAWLIVVLSAYSAHIYDRHLRRLVLSRVPNIPRVKSSSYDLSSRVNARTKLAELRKLQDMLDNKYISSTFQNIFNLGKVLHIENQILEIFTEADKDELNLILSTAELGHIFYKVKDHKFVQQFNRTKLLQTLAIDRLNELNITARTMLLDAFQKMKLTAHPKADVYVKNIITSTKGDQLSELKSLSDCKGDINSFHKLVYRDIENPIEKDNILNHIRKQAMIQEAHNKIGSRAGKQRGLMAWRKVLSDVDDTLTCSGGVWPAGMDTRYPRKAIYPGVLSFYRELDLGTTGDDSWDANTRVGNLVFLSARPHLYKEVSEAHNYAKFRDLQEKRGLYASPTLLTGSLSTGTNFIVGGSPEPLAIKKFENMTEYLQVYPEFSCILVGDNGQGDVRAAEMVMDSDELRGNLTRSYIHLVQPLYQTHTLHLETKKSTHNKICYFTNYIEAAIDAYKCKLIKLNGLRRIMVETLYDFALIPKEAWASTQDTVDARMRELNSSLYEANKILAKNNVNLVKLMRFRCRFPNGSLVKTFMGTGVVTRFRDSDGIYEVLIQWDKSGIQPPVKAFLQGHIKDPSDRLCDSRGAVAWTPYGLGVVEDFRESDDMVIVKLHWGATSNISRLQVIQLTDPAETLSYRKPADNEETLQIGNVTSLIHGSANKPTLEAHELDNNSVNNDNSDLFVNSADQIASTVEKSKKRPSMFPSWLPFLGSSQVPSNDNLQSMESIDEDDSTKNEPKSLLGTTGVSEFENLQAHTQFGPAKIVNIWASSQSSNDGKALNVMIEVNFTSWKLADSSTCHAKGHMSPDCVYIQNSALKGSGSLDPIGEEISNLPCDDDIQYDTSLSSHPAFTRLINQQQL
eukprot:GSChrysophyteH2.ASY1.ANO1.676.1 assembled CDS